MIIRPFVDISAVPQRATFKLTGKKDLCQSLKAFRHVSCPGVLRKQARVFVSSWCVISVAWWGWGKAHMLSLGAQGQGAQLVLMKANSNPPGGSIPPAKSMSHAAPRPKVGMSHFPWKSMILIAYFSFCESDVNYVIACLQKSRWYQKLGQSFNAPGITQFGKLTLVGCSSPILRNISWREN